MGPRFRNGWLKISRISSVAALVWSVIVGSAEFLRLSLGPVGDARFVLTKSQSVMHTSL